MPHVSARWIVLASAGTVVAAVLLGPRVGVDARWVSVGVGDDVAEYLRASEGRVAGLEAAEAKLVVWLDADSRARTPLSIVYLHGFSADHHEVDPLVQTLGRRLGANVFLTRLAGHGLDSKAMGQATAEDWFRDAAEAVAVGQAIGDAVVLMGASTGATLAVWAAAQGAASGDAHGGVAALVVLSPNFQPKDRASRMLLGPWGGAIARIMLGAERCWDPQNPAEGEHWTTCYPTKTLLPMLGLVEHVRTMPLDGVRAPTLILYSPGDRVVEPLESLRRFPSFGGEPKRIQQVPDPGDVGSHTLAGDFLSPGTTAFVVDAVMDFLAAAGVVSLPAGVESQPAGDTK